MLILIFVMLNKDSHVFFLILHACKYCKLLKLCSKSRLYNSIQKLNIVNIKINQ